MEKIRVGIFFGGPSREREISFAGGRTVYDNLNKSIYEPVLIFIDSNRNHILLDWKYIYKGTIRDFYPPVDALPYSENNFQIYIESLGHLGLGEYDNIISKIGRRIPFSELSELIDIAFLALHGLYGEDGQIQGLLESLKIPYTGSGLLPCALGMDKAEQKKFMAQGDFLCPEVFVINRKEWIETDRPDFFTKAQQEIGFPLVIRPANQGSSIGVSILKEENREAFMASVDTAFFIKKIVSAVWKSKSKSEKAEIVREVTDVREGVGFPLELGEETIFHPEILLKKLDEHAEKHQELTLTGHLSEQKVIVESFIKGKEFSCIVIRKEDGGAIALPPTEIRKGNELFDYRSKYLPGLSRKITPIDLPDDQIEKIRLECERLFTYLSFNTYARIDGFITQNGDVILNDPNTTSGMLPSSFFFHQAAEIGLDPSQFLSYVIRTSLLERINTSLEISTYTKTLDRLDDLLSSLQSSDHKRKKIAVVLGGYSFERHISVESGRNIYEKLASSDKYDPIPVFLSGDPTGHELYQIPINLLLKDNADDIRDKIRSFYKHPLVEKIREACLPSTSRYMSNVNISEPLLLTYDQLKEEVDGVFIALHGRPGEDGNVQKRLEALGLPYNGSGPSSSEITIDKFQTIQTLKEHGFSVTDQELISGTDFFANRNAINRKISDRFGFPLIAKPVDDGCSSAVRLVKNEKELDDYLSVIFRENEVLTQEMRDLLGLTYNEEFPAKKVVLIEALIAKKDATHFMEITGGMLTDIKNGHLTYEIFEPSEALAGSEILSLEEKFLAGEGQNITPARFGKNGMDYDIIARQVKRDLERAAKILKVKGYARIDAFVRIYENNKAETIIIEVNSLPGMTPATCIFHQSAINGYKPYDFIDKILEFAFNEQKQNLRVE